jgi:hypothetical protein
MTRNSLALLLLVVGLGVWVVGLVLIAGGPEGSDPLGAIAGGDPVVRNGGDSTSC